MNGDDMTGARLERLLAGALREGVGGDGGEGAGAGEREAVTEFLLARDTGAHKVARTRRRDDWR
ncbi:hypothetical protein RB628_24870 [Streptomyces sp. ADMS]|uniref:hypothetical protein n=1 Tax=Streptomyces sp. ADMS TaxID=3071415 RepID=UPI00296E6693|nr:hypothetical protein [Streptomyces sp. ADMS]MDW4908483.1 hypothetical protein [Streptomyces sp. ADMS]